jgi:hypothetical protein
VAHARFLAGAYRLDGRRADHSHLSGALPPLFAETQKRHVWGVFGYGEMDEPESIAGLSLAARERLDNLTFVINCNLQRLDGSVRGNGQIIPELESLFRGAGWNVIVLWGSEWDALFARALSHCEIKIVVRLPSRRLQAAATASRHVVIAAARRWGIDARVAAGQPETWQGLWHGDDFDFCFETARGLSLPVEDRTQPNRDLFPTGSSPLATPSSRSSAKSAIGFNAGR